MGVRHRGPSGPAGLEARERFEAFQAARSQVARAQEVLAVVTASEGADPAFAAGADLARRRLRRAEAHCEAMLLRLADGRPPYEAFWGLPDDL